MCLNLEYFQNNPDQEGLLLQVDYEKAFDLVEHNFLTFYSSVWKNLGLVKVAFFGCINGHLSSPIYIFRGLHQGSPLSPILFLLVVQIGFCKLDSRHDISGIRVQGVDIFLSLFSDDTDIFTQASIQCIDTIVHEISEFGVHSGCKTNVSKTSCIPLGRARYNTSLLEDSTDKFVLILSRTHLLRLESLSIM